MVAHSGGTPSAIDRYNMTAMELKELAPLLKSVPPPYKVAKVSDIAPPDTRFIGILVNGKRYYITLTRDTRKQVLHRWAGEWVRSGATDPWEMPFG